MRAYISTNIIVQSAIRYDRHALSGSVKIEGIADSRNIYIINRFTAQILRAIRSGLDGVWKVVGMSEFPEKSLMVICIDDTGGSHNAQIFDFVSQYAPNPPATEDATSEGAE